MIADSVVEVPPRQGRGEVAVWQWLDRHINRETSAQLAPGGSGQPGPTLGVIEQLLHALGQPQRRGRRCSWLPRMARPRPPGSSRRCCRAAACATSRPKKCRLGAMGEEGGDYIVAAPASCGRTRRGRRRGGRGSASADDRTGAHHRQDSASPRGLTLAPDARLHQSAPELEQVAEERLALPLERFTPS